VTTVIYLLSGTIVVLVLLVSAASGADAGLCRSYATTTSVLLGRFSWLRAYTSCINADELPPAPDTVEEAHHIVWPWMDLPPAPPQSCAVGVKTTVSSPPALVCARAHRSIVWSGRSWHCT